MSNLGPDPVSIVQLRRYKRKCESKNECGIEKSVKTVRVSDSIGQRNARNALASSGGNKRERVNENLDVLRR